MCDPSGLPLLYDSFDLSIFEEPSHKQSMTEQNELSEVSQSVSHLPSHLINSPIQQNLKSTATGGWRSTWYESAGSHHLLSKQSVFLFLLSCWNFVWFLLFLWLLYLGQVIMQSIVALLVHCSIFFPWWSRHCYWQYLLFQKNDLWVLSLYDLTVHRRSTLVQWIMGFYGGCKSFADRCWCLKNKQISCVLSLAHFWAAFICCCI